MLINVPQYIDVEDKIVGPLTAKQLGWVIALGIILLVLWNMSSKPVFFIVGLPATLLFLALAFYRPYGQPLGSFVIFGVMYFFRPKVYFWKRTPQKEVRIAQKNTKIDGIAKDKRLTADSLKDLAQLLDSEGMMKYNEDLENVLKKIPVKK